MSSIKINKYVQLVSYILIPMFLYSCKGSTSNTETTTEVSAEAVRIGSFVDGKFQKGVLGITTKQLSSTGSTNLHVDLVDANGALISEPFPVSFSSYCVENTLASIDIPIVYSVNGSAETSYNATGCSGIDNITASIASICYDEECFTDLTASGSVLVEQGNAG